MIFLTLEKAESLAAKTRITKTPFHMTITLTIIVSKCVFNVPLVQGRNRLKIPFCFRRLLVAV